jgi:hypothetical protein
MTTATYEQDFFQWTQEQALLMRQGRLAEIDIEHVMEEVERMGASERRELYNRLKILLAHLLKWRCQPERRGNSWRLTIIEQRDQLDYLLKQSPSLKPVMTTAFVEAYPKARQRAALETGLGESMIPADNPFTLEQTLNSDYWPDS